MNGHNYKGTRFQKLKDMNKGGEEQKLYEAAGNCAKVSHKWSLWKWRTASSGTAEPYVYKKLQRKH